MIAMETDSAIYRPVVSAEAKRQADAARARQLRMSISLKATSSPTIAPVASTPPSFPTQPKAQPASPIPSELFAEAWELIDGQHSRYPTVMDVQRAAIRYFRISQADLASPRRDHAVMRPRQIAMYVAKKLTLRSLPEIGRRFGDRDHTTVLHAVRQIDRLIDVDPRIATDVSNLKQMIEETLAS